MVSRAFMVRGCVIRARKLRQVKTFAQLSLAWPRLLLSLLAEPELGFYSVTKESKTKTKIFFLKIDS